MEVTHVVNSSKLEIMEKQDSLDEPQSVVDRLIENSTTAVAIAELDEFLTDDFQDEFQEKSRKKSPVRRPRVVRKRDRCKEQTVNCLKKSCLYMLSYVGLTCTVVGYSILGGIIFPALEAPHEKRVQDQAKQLRTNYTEKIEMELWLVLHNHVHYNKTYNYTGVAEKLLREFQITTYDLINTDGWSGVDDELGGEDKWSFASGLLYAVTVITTIGYGFIVPKTIAGQAITMLYATIGIPLTFLCLSKIGGVMASLFRALYGRTLCVECRRTFLLSMMARRAYTVTADKIELDNLQNDQEAIEYTMATAEHTHKEEVPIIVCLILVVWYVAFGAVLFTIWETKWDLFTGAYFCFITLSTIGFGDIVPGFSRQEWDDNVKQVVCSLYLLIGLSTLAMVFDLMQQRGRVLASKFGALVGLLKKK